MFKAGYSGGHTPDEAPPPDAHVDELAFGPSRRWERPGLGDEGPEGPSDMTRMVATIRQATAQLAIEAPRAPWLPSRMLSGWALLAP